MNEFRNGEGGCENNILEKARACLLIQFVAHCNHAQNWTCDAGLHPRLGFLVRHTMSDLRGKIPSINLIPQIQVQTIFHSEIHSFYYLKLFRVQDYAAMVNFPFSGKILSLEFIPRNLRSKQWSECWIHRCRILEGWMKKAKTSFFCVQNSAYFVVKSFIRESIWRRYYLPKTQNPASSIRNPVS